MNDEHIETLSKAIDALVHVRKILTMGSSTPNPAGWLKQELIHVTSARYLVACLASHEEWKP